MLPTIAKHLRSAVDDKLNLWKDAALLALNQVRTRGGGGHAGRSEPQILLQRVELHPAF
jgi:hypothetical protein